MKFLKEMNIIVKIVLAILVGYIASILILSIFTNSLTVQAEEVIVSNSEVAVKEYLDSYYGKYNSNITDWKFDKIESTYGTIQNLL